MTGIAACALAALLAASAWSRDQTPIQQPRALPPQRGTSQTTAAPSAPAQPKPAPSASTPPVKKSAAAKPHLTDAQLEAVIRAKFAKSKLAADKLTVHVQGGVATIEGHTGVVQHKGNATRMAKTAGAVAVNNHVVVSDAAKEKAAQNLDIAGGDLQRSPDGR